MAEPWPLVRLSDVLTLQRRWLQPEVERRYTEIGVRSYGRGIFHKAPVTGADLGTKRVLRIESGDLVLMNVFAWEGAVAVAGDAEDGTIGSHRYATYTADPQRCSMEFLNLYFKTEPGRDILRRVSPGSAGRNRTLNLAEFATQSVPLPPLDEQRRIVGRVGAIAAKVEEAQRLRQTLESELQSLLISYHLSRANGRVVQIDAVLSLQEERVPVVNGASYPQVGLKSFGQGLFKKGSVTSVDTAYRTFNRLFDGAIVLSQVKGWEGAIASAGPELAGWFASPEYRTFRCIPAAAIPEYLGPLFATEWFWRQLSLATKGMGDRRERTRPEQFLTLPLPMPSLEDQKKGAVLFERLQRVRAHAGASSQQTQHLLPTVLDRAFRGEL